MVNYFDFLNFFKKGKKVFFVGIGGISMSSLAIISQKNGIEVSGYDYSENSAVIRLKELGIPVYRDFSEEIFNGVDLVVYTGAIKDSSPFLSYPKKIGIPIMKRPQFLGFLMKTYSNPIGIAGTHGKSTTTGMIASVFIEAGRQPTVLIGAECDSFPDKTYLLGRGEDFIFEACEYQDSFLSFFPNIAIVLNADYDHADYFPSHEAVIDSFVKWTNIPDKSGKAVINLDNDGAKSVFKKTDAQVFTFSLLQDADCTAKDIENENGFYSFTLKIGKSAERIKLKVPGKHNVSNALAAASAAYISGISPSDIKKGIENYTGIKRRFEYKGKCNNMTVIDDYAHHPDEINATMKTALQTNSEKITVVFQSHTYTRTKAYFDDFIDSLKCADEVIFADIYAARETPIEGIDAKTLAEKSENGKYVGNFEDIINYLKSKKDSGLLIIMGAGDIAEITPKLING